MVTAATLERLKRTVGSWNPDVLLVNPIKGAPGDEYSGRRYAETLGPLYMYGRFHYNWPAEPVYFNLLASELRRHGISCEIADGFCHRFNADEMVEVIALFRPKMVGFAAFYNTLPDTLAAARHIKSSDRDVPVILGSAFVSPHWQAVVARAEVDYVIVGDGEIAFRLLAERILVGETPVDVPGVAYLGDGGPALAAPAPLSDIDALAFGARDLVPIVLEDGHGVSIYSSRGCAFANCSFCYLLPYQKVSLQPKWRYRSAESVVDEIEDLVSRFGLDRVGFVDEDYFGDNQVGLDRAIRVAELLVERRIDVRYYVNGLARSILALKRRGQVGLMRQSGLENVFIGFESASATALRGFRKPQLPSQYDDVIDVLFENGIRINPGLITFTPEGSLADVRANFFLARRVRYYDLFLFTRRLVNLGNAADLALAERSAGFGETAAGDGWLDELSMQHAKVVADFSDPRVGAACQLMRLLSHHLYDLLFEECAQRAGQVKRRRQQVIERHYCVADELLDWVEMSDPASLTFEVLEKQGREQANYIASALAQPAPPDSSPPGWWS